MVQLARSHCWFKSWWPHSLLYICFTRPQWVKLVHICHVCDLRDYSEAISSLTPPPTPTPTPQINSGTITAEFSVKVQRWINQPCKVSLTPDLYADGCQFNVSCTTCRKNLHHSQSWLLVSDIFWCYTQHVILKEHKGVMCKFRCCIFIDIGPFPIKLFETFQFLTVCLSIHQLSVHQAYQWHCNYYSSPNTSCILTISSAPFSSVCKYA